MSNMVNKCPEIFMTGNCSKKEDCNYCNQVKITDDATYNFNVNAKSFIPKSKRNANNYISNSSSVQSSCIVTNDFDKLKFNLYADEYKPKNTFNNQVHNFFNNDYEYEDKTDEFKNDDKEEAEEFDMILKDIINNEVLEEIEDDEESDEDKWLPKYKDCNCCKGYVFKCKGPACINLGTCFCKMQDDCEEDC
jgi:hypothetical protein